MIRLSAFFLLLGLSFALTNARADAETSGFRVRAGEHAGFSRLVLDFAYPVDWELRPTEAGYDLKYTANAGPADLSGVFRLIPRSRLQAIGPVADQPGILVLRLASDHRAEAFALPDGKLVIDISPGVRALPEGVTDAANSVAISENAVTAEGSVPETPDWQPPPSPQLVVLQPPGQLPELSPAGTDRRASAPRPDVSAVAVGPQPQARLPDLRLIAAQDRLVEQLGRAMTQGVVDPSGVGLPAPPARHLPSDQALATETTPEPVAAEPPLPTLSADDPSRYLDHLNLDARTIYDRTTGAAQSPPATSEPEPCLADSLFDFAVPDGGAAIRGRIAELRASLAGEFDRPDKAALDGLIRLYIGLGFGAEALALMATFPGMPDQAPLYRELASIMQRGYAEGAEILPRDAQCTGASGLWAIMARAEIPLGEEPDGPALAEYFADLPADLRRRIGPILGIRMLDAGFLAEARLIADRIARAPGPPGADLVLLMARLELAGDQAATARRALTGLVETDQPNAPDALELLLGDLLENGKAVPERLLTEASAIAFELRFSPAGARLRRMEILAHAASGEVAQAFDILIHESQLGALSQAELQKISSELFQRIAVPPFDGTTFAEAYFRYGHLLEQQPIDNPVRQQVARKLIQIGLPAEALKLLGPATGWYSPEDRLLAAGALLAQDLPDAADAALGDLTGAAAETLRWRIDAGRKDYSDALRRDSSGIDVNTREDVAWRSGRWDLLEDASLPTRRAAARLAGAAPQPPVLPAVPVLGDYQAVLDASQQARRDIDDLLGDHPTP